MGWPLEPQALSPPQPDNPLLQLELRVVDPRGDSHGLCDGCPWLLDAQVPVRSPRGPRAAASLLPGAVRQPGQVRVFSRAAWAGPRSCLVAGGQVLPVTKLPTPCFLWDTISALPHFGVVVGVWKTLARERVRLRGWGLDAGRPRQPSFEIVFGVDREGSPFCRL